jgi:ergothioneine biosynthesis protein EgtB
LYQYSRKVEGKRQKAKDVHRMNREWLVDWYRRNRARSRGLFDLIDPAVYYTRPISLRNPIVFYEGHLPAFSLISLVKRGLGSPGVDDSLERLFARGIDPDTEAAAVPRSGVLTTWPSRDAVLAFADAADRRLIEALRGGAFDLTGETHPAMRRGEAIFTALEHEAMHQETLLYMWHRLPHEAKRPDRIAPGVLPRVACDTAAPPPPYASVAIPAGTATLGADREQVAFGWDNEFDRHRVQVEAFEIDAHNVTNADFLAFVEAGGYADRLLWPADGWDWRESEGLRHPIFWTRANGGWHWRGMFEEVPLPPAWPVYVSHAEASAYARWKGRRLPTEAEYHRAAFGAPDGTERAFPWGDAPPDATRGNFDFASWEPIPAGSRPAGASAWGVHDLVGNGWEWTSTVFGPFDGFAPMASYPEYSADFFDGQHYVMKGASPATAAELIRRSFRNWFRPNYPYVYATFRTVA